MSVFSKMMAPIYEKMEDYIQSLFDIFQMINKKAVLAHERQHASEQKLQMISRLLFNYISYLSKKYTFEPLLRVNEYIDLVPVFEYVAFHQIELYEFDKIEMSDVDISKKEDIERFVLTHVYYLTQSK